MIAVLAVHFVPCEQSQFSSPTRKINFPRGREKLDLLASKGMHFVACVKIQDVFYCLFLTYPTVLLMVYGYLSK